MAMRDMAKMSVTGTPGTGSITLNAAVAGFQTFAAAGVVDGEVVPYSIVDTGSAWEVGFGTYTAAGTSLARTTILFSSNSNAAISMTSAANVGICALSEQWAMAGGTVTANRPVIDLTQTWNNAAVIFTAAKMDITATAYADGSIFQDYRLGGTSKLAIMYNAANGVGQINILGKSGFYFANSPLFGLTDQGKMGLNNRALNFGQSGTNLTENSNDPNLVRDANGTIAQVSGTNAQGFRVYNTYTDASNYERGVFDWTTSSNKLTIGVQKAGTGSSRNIGFTTGSSAWTLYINGELGDDIGGVHVNDGGNGHIRLWTSGIFTWADIGLSRIAALVVGFNQGSTFSDTSGWFNYGGQKRVTSDFSVTSSTALTDITGLSVNVAAGRTYTFEARLMVTDAAAGGVQAAINGTCTATAIQYTGWTIADNAIKGKTNATALNTAVGSTTTTETSGIVVEIVGTITVNAAGTLLVRMAQNTSNGTATIAKRGSYFIVQDMP